jgi:hypothetical protein
MVKNNKKTFKVGTKERPLSWSSISSFLYDPEQWYKKYFLGIKTEDTAELIFGKAFAQSIEDGTCEVKELMQALQKKKEHPFKAKFGKIYLIGYGDAFCDVTFKILDEVKTGAKEWTQKRADEHGQFDMYLLMNWLTKKIKPEEVICTLHWLPTYKRGDFSMDFVRPIKVHPFRTQRTMKQILNFGVLINRVTKEMEAYVKNHD